MYDDKNKACNDKNANKTLVTVYPGNTTSYLDNSNPYILIDDIDSDQTTTSRPESQPRRNSGDRGINLPDDLLQKALMLEKNNCLVRTICMLDIIMSCLYFFDGWIGGLLCLFASTNGYLATIYYKPSLMSCYLIYQYFQVFLRLANIITLVTEPQQYGYNRTFIDYTNQQDSSNGYFFNIGVYFFLFFCQTYIACFITRYYQLLPNNNERQRIVLLQHSAI